MCAASTSYTCSSSAIAQQHTPEMRNSVKKPGARIYSQLRRGCSTSIKSTWSRQPGKSPQVKPESVGPAHESKLHHLAGTIPRTGTRHLFQNIESGSPHHPPPGDPLLSWLFLQDVHPLVMGVRHKSVYVAVRVSLI